MFLYQRDRDYCIVDVWEDDFPLRSRGQILRLIAYREYISLSSFGKSPRRRGKNVRCAFRAQIFIETDAAAPFRRTHLKAKLPVPISLR